MVPDAYFGKTVSDILNSQRYGGWIEKKLAFKYD
jgi:hypothetical protein